MVDPIQCNTQAQSITLDLVINVTKAQTLTTVDLSVPVFVSSTGPLSQGAGRIQYYDTLAAVESVWGTTTESYKAATAFFSQNPRPQTMAIAQAFDTPQSGFMVTAQTGDAAAFIAVTDGSFNISIDGDNQDITGLDFSSETDLDDVAAVIEAALQAIGTGGYTAATVVASNATQNQFTITSGISGDGSSVSVVVAVSPATGTDISGLGFMNGQEGTTVLGYTPTTFTNELFLISEAATCAGRFVYGWALDVVYRDTQNQLDAAAWAETQLLIVMSALSNNPLSYDADNTTNNIYDLFLSGYTKTFSFFHNDADLYPDMALLAILLSVDYTGLNTTLTAKFKNLVGITTVGLTETQLQVLEDRRANTIVTMSIGVGGARTVRQGVQVSESWFCDDRTNTDNFVNDLLTAVYNVFLTTPKVPFTTAGQALLFAPENTTCNQYVRNGMLADRVVTDATQPNGINTIPACQIVFAPLQDISTASRDARIMSGNTITLQLAGAVHQLIINVILED